MPCDPSLLRAGVRLFSLLILAGIVHFWHGRELVCFSLACSGEQARRRERHTFVLVSSLCVEKSGFGLHDDASSNFVRPLEIKRATMLARQFPHAGVAEVRSDARKCKRRSPKS